jgi:hypothetical protein
MPCYSTIISPVHMETFQYTNAYFAPRVVAIYARLGHVQMHNFDGIIAGVSRNVYIMMIMSPGNGNY